MKSGTPSQFEPAAMQPQTAALGIAGAVVRVRYDTPFTIVSTGECLEISLSADAVAEVCAENRRKPQPNQYHTISDEVARLQLGEKTIRRMLKERGAPHYVVGSDIRIDPIEFDKWLDSNCSVRKSTKNPSRSRAL